MQNILVIGCGHMMSSLLVAQNKHSVKSSHFFSYTLVNKTYQKALTLKENLPDVPISILKLSDLTPAALDKYQGLFLAVKPFQLQELLEQNPNLNVFSGEIISLLAGIRLSSLENIFTKAALHTRLMPSITVAEWPSSAIFLSSNPQRTLLQQWYHASLGQLVAASNDEQFDQLTVLFGSNAAYVAALLSPWIKYLSTSLENSQSLMIDQFMTALQFLKNKNFADVIDRVKTPGGITAETLQVLESMQYPAMIQKALAASAERSRAIGENLSMS